jgi:hypothetical protein
MAIIRMTGKNVQPAKEQHFGSYAGRSDSGKNGQVLTKGREGLSPAHTAARQHSAPARLRVESHSVKGRKVGYFFHFFTLM